MDDDDFLPSFNVAGFATCEMCTWSALSRAYVARKLIKMVLSFCNPSRGGCFRPVLFCAWPLNYKSIIHNCSFFIQEFFLLSQKLSQIYVKRSHFTILVFHTQVSSLINNSLNFFEFLNNSIKRQPSPSIKSNPISWRARFKGWSTLPSLALTASSVFSQLKIYIFILCSKLIYSS